MSTESGRMREKGRLTEVASSNKEDVPQRKQTVKPQIPFSLKLPAFTNISSRLVWLLFCLLALLSGCVKNNSDTPLDLGYFSSVSRVSISPDGDQVLFTGCGHKDYSGCTIYRFQRSTGRLSRYIHKDSLIQVDDGRFSPSAASIIFVLFPLDAEKKKIHSTTQIGIANIDGTRYRQVTRGEGVKILPLFCLDEKEIIFAKGRYRESGKKQLVGLDFYKNHLQTDQETRITHLAFYGVSKAYLSADGKSIVFAGDTPMTLPQNDNIDFVKKYRADYWDHYYEHIILEYSHDGSEIGKEPTPIFSYDVDFGISAKEYEEKKAWWVENSKKSKYGGPGSRRPMLIEDGTIWFEGKVGPIGWIDYYRRFSDGSIRKIEHIRLWDSDNSLTEWDITPDGAWLLTLTENRTTHQRTLWVFQSKTAEKYELNMPNKVETIVLH